MTEDRSSKPALDAAQERALAVLREGRRFLLVGHVRPDGDCIGAQAALARVLEALGKEVRILNPDPPEPQFDYLARECAYAAYAGGDVPDHDVCVLLDISELDRCGALAEPLRRSASRKVVVDHHIHHGEPWWDEAFIDVTASATGLLVHRIAAALEAPLDDVARAGVFTSLVTDTGWFRYSNTDAETLRVAAELVGAGVEPARLYRAIFQRNDATQPIALGELLARLEYHSRARIAVVSWTLADDARLPLRDSDVVLDVLRSVESVEVVLFLRESQPGTCKLSARSKSEFDVQALCSEFGGGGHARASGATIEAALDVARERVTAAARRRLEAEEGEREEVA